MAGRVRVFELAKRLGIGNQDLMALLQELDITVTSGMAELDPGVDKLVQKKLGGQRATSRRVAAATKEAHDRHGEAPGGGGGKIKRKVRRQAAAERAMSRPEVPSGGSLVVPGRATMERRTAAPAEPTHAQVEVEEQEPLAPTIGPLPAGAERKPAAARRVTPPATVRTSTGPTPAAPEAPTEAEPEVPAPAPETGHFPEGAAPAESPRVEEPPATAAEAAAMAEAPPPAEVTAIQEAPAAAAAPAPEAPLAEPERPVIDQEILARVESTQRKKKKQTNLRDKVKQKLKESKERPAGTESLLPPVKEEPSERAQRRKERGPAQQFVDVPEVVTVDELAKLMSVKANEVILALMKDGVMATKNQQLDQDMVELLADKFDYQVRWSTSAETDLLEEELAESPPEELEPRAPVVTVMGHVDHGKTSLLDFIRRSKVAAGEAGGITQHIGAYDVKTDKGRVVFLDTPGHEAFTAMRAHGAQVTDVVVLVVAADDGVMPQTIEAINHAREAEVPLVVAVNKCDLPQADPDRVKRELSEHGVLVEGWGGEVQCVNVSAKTGNGVKDLLEMLSLESELLELKANPSRDARGVVIEAKLDRGRGAVATILVQHGTLQVGDVFVAGTEYGRVRSMLDDNGRPVKTAGPSTPVEILGFNGVPDAGDAFVVVEDERKARQIADSRSHKQRQKEAAKTAGRVSLEDLHKFIAEGEIEELKVIIKADVHGSVQALQDALEKLSTGEVRLQCIHGAVGGITESDVMLARASNALILGFNVRPEPKARKLAESQDVDIRLYRVIYDAIEDVRAAMSGLLKPETRETVTGRAEVRDTFRISGVGTVAGCMVLSGEISRNDKIRVIRDNVVVKEGDIASLRRFKDDVKAVTAGMECGLAVANFNDVKVGDVLETYTVEAIERTL